MRKWREKLALVAGGVIGLGGLIQQADAQYPPLAVGGPACSGGVYGPGAEPMGVPKCPPIPSPALKPAPPVVLPDDGRPAAFSEVEMPPRWGWPLIWAGAEGVYGITRKAPLNTPLVTGSTNPDPASEVGAIGQPSTQIIAGLGGINLQHPVGYRVTAGFSPTPEWRVPFECEYLYLHQNTLVFSYTGNSNGYPLLARPINSTQPGQEGEKVYLSSFPGLATGGVNIESSMQIWGVRGRGIVLTGCQWGDDQGGCAINLPIGYHYLELDDAINITSTLTPLNPAFAAPFLGVPFGPGNTTTVTDLFKASNQFNGAEFAIQFEARNDRFFLTFEPRVSVGVNHQAININGISTLSQPGALPITTPGGILAVATNGGGHTRDKFAYIPEVRLTAGVDVFPWMRLQVGYEAMYWTNVLRSGDHINRSVDVRQVPTDFALTPNNGSFNSPFFYFKESNFFLQSASIGLVFSY